MEFHKTNTGIKETPAYGENKIKYLSLTGIMATLITIMTAFICHIPVGINGGYIHFGDALIFLGAVLLPKPYAIAAAVIGAGIADALTAPVWLPATVLIKSLIALLFSCKTKKIVSPRNILALLFSFVVSGGGYFLAEYLLFGTWAVLFVSLGQSFVQFLGSAVLFILLGVAFDRAKIKYKLFHT